MQRYSLTKSGVCDCMVKDDNGDWVKYADISCEHKNIIVKRIETHFGVIGGKDNDIITYSSQPAAREIEAVYCNDCGKDLSDLTIIASTTLKL